LAGKCGRAIQMLSRYIDSTPEVEDILTGWQSIIQFDLVGEDPFYLSISGNAASFHEGRATTADVVLSGRSNVFFDVLTGKLDPDVAYMMKKYTVKGSVVDAMKFRRISELTEQAHKTTFSFMKAMGKIAFK
jgi:putative sterol carrier protein